MVYRLVNFLLKLITERLAFILLVLLTMLFSVYTLLGMWRVIHFTGNMSGTEIDQVNDMLDSLAGVFVAIGVLLEERATIRSLAAAKSLEVDSHLDTIAHHNGMGLLLIGLFMELISMLIDSPQTISLVHGKELVLYIVGITLVSFAVLVQIDFIKDYLKSYRRTAQTVTNEQ